MSTADHLVIALDDNPSVLDSLDKLLSAHGHPVRKHANRDDFLRAGLPEVPACLLLDYQLEDGISGTDVYKEMNCRGWNLPTIFLTGHGSVPLVVQAMREGADGFLTKPYDPQELLEEVERALEHARTLAETRAKESQLLARAAKLTAREREIVVLVVEGCLNKEIADRLDLALVTVKVHRSRAMHKLGAGNPAELAQLAIQAGIVKPN